VPSNKWKNSWICGGILASNFSHLEFCVQHLERGASALKWFDEFLSENELDLALHVVCDFLLETESPPESPELSARLQSLLSKMEIVDDCVLRLRQKAVAEI